MKIKLDRVISIATLVASLVAIFLVLKKPAPVAQPQTPSAIAANAQVVWTQRWTTSSRQYSKLRQRRAEITSIVVAESADDSCRPATESGGSPQL